jgi:hypothetical protein
MYLTEMPPSRFEPGTFSFKFQHSTSELKSVRAYNNATLISSLFQAHHLLGKAYEILCCTDGCCDRCLGLEEKKKTLTKQDIQYTFKQPCARINSDTDSILSYGTGRERIDSDNSAKDSICSQDSLANRRSGTTPVIDMKPIEFWTANKETIQPRTPRMRLSSETESITNIKPDLYESPSRTPTEECLTDEEKLARFQLGQIHFSLQYEIPTKTLIVKIIEARDLPPPFSMDESKQDMAHSNPYAKISLLPDSKNSKQTSVQKKTQEPVWGEIFSFEIPFKEASRRTLEIIVKDFDKYSRHCIIGQVHLPLANVNIIKGRHMWKPLMPSNKVSDQKMELY